MSDFEELVRRHQAAVCATAYAVLRDRARSEEIAQDAFLVAWQKLPSLSPPPSPLPAWICGIARNLARNAARKHREVPMIDDDLPGATSPRDATSPLATASPLDTVLRREHLDLANRALAALPDADRELVVLYYRCDESIAAVASSLAIPEPTARKRLSRTRARLRDALVAVEAMLRVTRPGPAFTAACVAALAAGRAVEASAATHAVTRAMPRTGSSALVRPLALGAVVVGALAVVGPRDDRPVAPTGAPLHATGSSRSPASIEVVLPAGIRRIAATDRAAMLARIRAARIAAAPVARVYDFADTDVATAAPVDIAAGAAPPDTSAPVAPRAALTKGTLRAAIARLHPMLRACGDDHGRLAVKLRLAGEERGTVVESVEITGDPPLSDDAELVDCVRTTLESLELPPTHDPVPWDVSYPFVF